MAPLPPPPSPATCTGFPCTQREPGEAGEPALQQLPSWAKGAAGQAAGRRRLHGLGLLKPGSLLSKVAAPGARPSEGWKPAGSGAQGASLQGLGCLPRAGEQHKSCTSLCASKEAEESMAAARSMGTAQEKCATQWRCGGASSIVPAS